MYRATMSWRVRVCLLLVGCALQVLCVHHQPDRVKLLAAPININKLLRDEQLIEEPSSNDSTFTMVENDTDPSASSDAENWKMSSNLKITAKKLVKKLDRDYDKLWFSTTPDSYYKYSHGKKRVKRMASTQVTSKENNILYYFTAEYDANANNKDRNSMNKLPSTTKNATNTNSSSPRDNRRLKRQKFTTQDRDPSYGHRSPSPTMKIQTFKNISPVILNINRYAKLAHATSNDNNITSKQNMILGAHDSSNVHKFKTPVMLGLNQSYKLHAAEHSTNRKILPIEKNSYDNRKYNLNLDVYQKHDLMAQELIESETKAVKLNHHDAGKMNVLVHKQPKNKSLNEMVMQRQIDKLNLNKLLTGEKLNFRSDQIHLAEQALLPIYRYNELTNGKSAMHHKRNGANGLAIQVDMDRKQSRSDKLLLGEEAIAREHAKLVHDINSLLEYNGWSGIKTAETTTEPRDEEDSIYIEDLETRTQASVMSTAAPRTPSVNLKIIPKTVSPGKPAVALPLIVVGGDTTKHLTKPLPTHPYPFVGAASTSFPMRLRPVMYAYPIRSKPTLWQRFVALFPKIGR